MTNTTNNSRAPFDSNRASRYEKYVTVLATGGQVPGVLVHKNFPLSLLLKYSARAKSELGHHWIAGMTGLRYIDWSIEMPVVNNAIEVRALQDLFRWILETQPAEGYPQTFNGKQQFSAERLRTGLIACLYLYKTTYQLGLEPPLSRTALRNRIRMQIDNVIRPITADELTVLIKLCHEDDKGLVTIALARNCEHFKEVKYNHPSFKAYNDVYEKLGKDIQEHWDDLSKKQDRKNAWEKRQRQQANPAASSQAVGSTVSSQAVGSTSPSQRADTEGAK